MNPERLAPNTYLFSTDGIDELSNREDHDQELDKQAEEMVRSWDMNKLKAEADKIKDSCTDRRANFETDYYDGEDLFDDIKEKMEEVVKDRLWINWEARNPEGNEILPSSTVQFDRIGYLELDPNPFESSIIVGKPITANLGTDSQTLGMVQALLHLREGESAQLLISPHWLYGPLGAPPLIPKNAFILYYVRVYRVWDESDLAGMVEWERTNGYIVPLEDKMELAIEQKNVANTYLADDKPREALIRYKAALKWIDETSEEEIQQSKECQELLGTLWQNVAITLNKLENYKSATKAAKQALNYNPKNIKAIYQLAKARMGLGDHERALVVLRYGREVDPKNASLLHLRARLDVQLTDEKAKRDEIMLRMSKACSL